jgi:hypothetical protein
MTLDGSDASLKAPLVHESGLIAALPQIPSLKLEVISTYTPRRVSGSISLNRRHDYPPVQTVLGSQQSNAAIQGSKSWACQLSVTASSLSPPRVQIVPSERETTMDAGLRKQESALLLHMRGEYRAYSAVGRRVDQSRERQRVFSSAQSMVWRGESLFWGGGRNGDAVSSERLDREHVRPTVSSSMPCSWTWPFASVIASVICPCQGRGDLPA